jgi:hypothetical protein
MEGWQEHNLVGACPGLCLWIQQLRYLITVQIALLSHKWTTTLPCLVQDLAHIHLTTRLAQQCLQHVTDSREHPQLYDRP